MIRFADGVTLEHVTYDLIPLLLNVLMWSARSGKDVVLHDIQCQASADDVVYRRRLTVRLDTLPADPALREQCFAYLRRTFPSTLHAFRHDGAITVRSA